MKIEINDEGRAPYTLDTIAISDRLDHLAGRLLVAELAITGAAEELSEQVLLGEVAGFPC